MVAALWFSFEQPKNEARYTHTGWRVEVRWQAHSAPTRRLTGVACRQMHVGKRGQCDVIRTEVGTFYDSERFQVPKHAYKKEVPTLNFNRFQSCIPSAWSNLARQENDLIMNCAHPASHTTPPCHSSHAAVAPPAPSGEPPASR